MNNYDHFDKAKRKYLITELKYKGLNAELNLFISVDDDVLLLDLKSTNNRPNAAKIFVTNYLEFSLFEYFKEIIGWEEVSL